MTKLAVLTSGGDAPGMNAALRAIAKTAASREVELLGVLRGYDGLIDGDARPLVRRVGAAWVPDAELQLAGGQGGTILGSVRSSRFRTPQGRQQAAAWMTHAGVTGLIVIGGNGSLTGAHVLAQETGVRVVGIPASIDNDLGCTSTALGVDTALNTILEACDRISDTARAHRRAFLVEVMGRHCGYLAMASAVASAADAVLFPETHTADKDVLGIVEEAIVTVFANHDGPRRALIIKAEGVDVPTTRLVRELQPRLDAKLGDVDVRGVVLGHVVRGGAPSVQDRLVAGRFGFGAVDALLDGASDVMLAWRPHTEPEGAQPSRDPAVVRVPLDVVLRETDALLDGSSPTTMRRVRMMEAAHGVLAL